MRVTSLTGSYQRVAAERRAQHAELNPEPVDQPSGLQQWMTGRDTPMLVACSEPPARPRTHAADRTRSKRWRAGSPRTRKLARLARKQGRRTPFADPWRGWTAMGWINDTQSGCILDETHQSWPDH